MRAISQFIPVAEARTLPFEYQVMRGRRGCRDRFVPMGADSFCEPIKKMFLILLRYYFFFFACSAQGLLKKTQEKRAMLVGVLSERLAVPEREKIDVRH